ncbi:MAG: FHA domain-containing protein [Bdellovibrionales bacterium]|nr:FHA domain-containing protein [Bdellovibrionales bacterium]
MSIWSMIEGEISQAPFGVRVLLNQEILKIIRLDPKVTYIGRMPENHVVLDDSKVSRSHARIVYKDDNYYVEDQDSENGILVNGSKTKRAKLKVGDQVLVGSHILEVISADESIQPVALNEQVDLHHDEEWRLDETISIHTGALSKGSQGVPKSQLRNAAMELPTLHLTLKIGDDVIIRDVVLDKGKKLKSTKAGENALFVALKVGKWVLEKKIPLE